MCGMAGTLSRILHWQGVTPEWARDECRTCEGVGWLTAPPYYKQPVSQWPHGSSL